MTFSCFFKFNHISRFPFSVCTVSQGWLKTWVWQLWPKIITFIPLWILINHTNIIYLSSKSTQFCKIRRLWLKNWACHAHLKFKIQKGVAGSIFEPYPLNFEKMCISYRCSNDVNVIFWYSQPKIHKLKKTDFFGSWWASLGIMIPKEAYSKMRKLDFFNLQISK